MVAYFDHNATTPVHPEVFQSMQPYLEDEFGNASCLYRLGVNANYAIEKARLQLSRLIHAKAEEIVFTSGGTESDNLALKGIVLGTGKKHVITSSIEHPAVMKSCQFMHEYMDCEITYLPVNAEGRVDPGDVEKAIRDDTALVSIMTANNEIGTIQPIEEIGALCRQHAVVFHTDAVQATGRIAIDVEEMKVDLLSISGHKMYGPKGVGALYVRENVPLVSIAQGGSHEFGYRSGTENVPGIVGLGKAADLARNEMDQRAEHATRLCDRLWEKLLSLNMDMKRNSPENRCLPGTLNVTFANINSREFVRAMDEEGFCLATGSACSTGKTTPSYVLKAIGCSDMAAISSLRISLGCSNTDQQIDQFIAVLPQVIDKVKGIALPA